MESDYNKKFDSKLKKKFDEFSPEIPSSIWNGIERELDKENTAEPIISKVSSGTNLKRYMSFAASLLFVGFAIWKVQPEEKIFLRGSEDFVQKANVAVIDTIRQVAQVEDIKVHTRTNYDTKKKEPIFESHKDVSLEPVKVALSIREKNIVIKSGSISEIEDNVIVPDNEIAIALSSRPANTTLVTSSLNLEESPAIINQEEQYLPDSQPQERQKIVSTVLNFVASNLKVRDKQVVEFTETEHGIIKVDLKGLFAKNN